MPSARFELAIRAIKRPHTYAVDRTATGIGWHSSYMSRISRSLLTRYYLQISNDHFPEIRPYTQLTLR